MEVPIVIMRHRARIGVRAMEQLSPPNFFGSNPIAIVVGSTSVAVRAK